MCTNIWNLQVNYTSTAVLYYFLIITWLLHYFYFISYCFTWNLFPGPNFINIMVEKWLHTFSTELIFTDYFELKKRHFSA